MPPWSPIPPWCTSRSRRPKSRRRRLEIEVVDLRCLKPLDHDTILASLARTGRMFAVAETFPFGGVAAEVIAVVATEGFELLDAPPRRLTSRDTPSPTTRTSGAPTARPPHHRRSRPPAAGFLSNPSFILHFILHTFSPMPLVPITLPQLGESIAEGTIVSILVAVGDSVAADQEIFEVETQKATMGVPALCAGTMASIATGLNETHPVGHILAYLETSEEEVLRTGVRTAESRQGSSAPVSTATAGGPKVEPSSTAFRCRPRPPAPVTFPRACAPAWTNSA